MFEWTCKPGGQDRQKQGILRARHRSINALIKRRLREAGQLYHETNWRAYWLHVTYDLIEGTFPSITHLMISRCRGPYRWTCLYREGTHEGAVRRDDGSQEFFLNSNSAALSALEDFVFKFEQEEACVRIIRMGPRAIPHLGRGREEDVPEFLAAARNEEPDLAAENLENTTFD